MIPQWAAMMKVVFAVGLLSGLPSCAPPEGEAADPLPSWKDGGAKRAILEFVETVTDPGGASFVPAEERIAVFDNDGTLWAEQPLYVQLQFALDRVRVLAPEHPEWRSQQPFKGVLEGDLRAVADAGMHGLMQIVGATHAGMSTEEFDAIVSAWIDTATHPRFNRRYTECVYQPMLELLELLREKGFATYIVSGGGIDFMRPWTDRVYGIPPEQVIGSTIVTRYELKDGVPTLVRMPEIDFINDKQDKPVAIQRSIGRRPIAAFGNSDGDHQMLQWTAAGPGPRLMVLIHHTDGEREWAYDRESHVGRLDRALDEARDRGWTVVSMKDDWLRIYPFDEPPGR